MLPSSTTHDFSDDAFPGPAEQLTAAHWLRQARHETKSGLFQRALDSYDRALELDPGSAVAWAGRGETLWRLGKAPECIASCRQALGLDRQAAPALARLGVALLAQDEVEEALVHLEAAVALPPHTAWAWQERMQGLEEGSLTGKGAPTSSEPSSWQALAAAARGMGERLRAQRGRRIQKVLTTEERPLPQSGQVWHTGYWVDARYELLAAMRGGMGLVWICHDHTRGRTYALKTLQQRLLEVPGLLDRFLGEAENWARLGRHPHVVQAEFVRIIEGRPCIFLEYVAGGSLADLLRERPLSQEAAVDFALQVCDGLEHACGTLGIIHCDVKPSNVLLTEDRVAKVTDFGVARAAAEIEAEQAAEDAPHLHLGTPAYMSPEQYNDPAHVDERSDIYCFGATLFELLTRRWVFQGSTEAELRDKHTSVPAPDPRTINTAIRADISALVLRCLEKDPAQRLQSFAEVRAELQRIYEDLTGRVRASTARGEEARTAREWSAQAASLAQLGKYQEALASYNRALAMDEELAGAWTGKANVLARLGRHREAVDCCERAIFLRPNNPVAWNNKGLYLAALGLHEQAAECYDRAIQADPGFHQAWHNRGLALESLQRYQEALASYDRALEINERSAATWLSKAVCLAAAGRYREAVEASGRAAELDPGADAPLRVRGAALEALGLYAEALPLYEGLLATAPDDAEIEARVHRLRRQTAAGVEQAPTDEQLAAAGEHLQAGRESLHEGRLEEAEQHLRAATRLAPDNRRAWQQLLALLFRERRYDEAEEPARRCVDLDPTDHVAHHNLGIVLRKAGRWAEARGSLRAALYRDPTYEKAREELAKVEARDPLRARLAPPANADRQGGEGRGSG